MSNDLEPIEWNPEFYLTKNNFLGDVDESDLHDARTRSHTHFTFEHSIKEDKKRYKIKVVRIWVTALFDPQGSWIRPKALGELNLPKLIKHEQGHFDLAEKHARRFERKLKRQFQNKTFSFNKNSVSEPVEELKNIIQIQFEILHEELEQAHIDYDKITKHGTISNEQEKLDVGFAQLRQKK